MKNDLVPSRGWLFIEQFQEPFESFGSVRVISVGMDPHGLYDIVQFDEPKPIQLKHLGLIAVRTENITQWGDHGNLQLGRSEI